MEGFELSVGWAAALLEKEITRFGFENKFAVRHKSLTKQNNKNFNKNPKSYPTVEGCKCIGCIPSSVEL